MDYIPVTLHHLESEMKVGAYQMRASNVGILYIFIMICRVFLAKNTQINTYITSHMV